MADWNRDDDGDDAGDRGGTDRNDGWHDEPPSSGFDPDGDARAGGTGPGAPRGGATSGNLLTTTAVSIALVVLGFGIGVVSLMIAMFALLLGAGIDLTENVILLIVLSTVLLQGVGFGSAALAYLRYQDLGIEYVRARTPTWNDAKWTVLGFFGAFGLLIVGTMAVTALGVETQGHELGQLAEENPDLLLALIPLSFLLIGPGEELLFRGIIQTSFVERIGTGAGIAAASAIFALIHLPNYGGLQGLPMIGVLFLVSLAFGFVYERTDNLFVPAMVHAAYNAVQFGLLYVGLKYGPEMSGALVW